MSPEFKSLLSRDLASLMREAASLRDAAFGDRITFSKKVFIPLTHLCRDNCGYCTFVHPPKKGERAYLSPEQVLEIARAGQKAGCIEALFTLGDKPELKWKPAAEELQAMGYATTLDYLAAMGALVLKETGLLPHFNPGLMEAADLAKLRKSSVSMGIMIESTAERLGERGGPHFGAPDKVPALRLATLKAAGEARVPFTSGILIGIGETREERLEALAAQASARRSAAQQPPAPPPPVVTAITVQAGAVPNIIELPGRIEAIRTGRTLEQEILYEFRAVGKSGLKLPLTAEGFLPIRAPPWQDGFGWPDADNDDLVDDEPADLESLSL